MCFSKEKKRKQKQVCLGYQCETLKQHDATEKKQHFLRHITHSRKVQRLREYYATTSERERQRQRNDDDNTNNVFAFFEGDVVKKEFVVVFVF